MCRRLSVSVSGSVYRAAVDADELEGVAVQVHRMVFDAHVLQPQPDSLPHFDVDGTLCPDSCGS
jgi:hypothetical protein